MGLLTSAGLPSCEPGASQPEAAPLLSIVASVGGGPTEAFQQTDRVEVRVRAGESVVHEESVGFTPEDGAHVRVRLSPSLVGSTLGVEVALFAGSGATFRGSGSTILAEGRATEVELSLLPVVATLHLDTPVALLTAIGEARVLQAVALFSTEDIIPEPELAWSSLDPSILQLSPTGTGLALAEGEARIEVRSGAVMASGSVLVQAEVDAVLVLPPTLTLGVGQSLGLAFEVRDRNGNVLGGRSAEWRSLNESVATVSSGGVVLGVGGGIAQIEAIVDGVSGTAQVTVSGAPQSPSGLEALLLDEVLRQYRLSWVDNSTDETHFVVDHRFNGGPWTELATAAANTTTFLGTADIGTYDFRVRACGGSACSTPSNTERLVFFGEPPRVETLPAELLALPGGPGVLLRGRVTSPDPYALKFQFALDPDELERCLASEICEETKVQSGAGVAEWSDLIPEEWEWWAYYGVYFRIVAANGFGVSEGAILYFQNEMFGAPAQPVPSDVAGGEPAGWGASTGGDFP